MGSLSQDLTARQFGRWTVLAVAPKGPGHPKVLCRCSCGTEREVSVYSLRRGVSRSCGCLALEVTRERATKHGLVGTPEYEAWQGMLKRCYYAKDKRFSRYGGRGITVCDRWRDSFEDFFADMGAKPSPKHSIDRIDNDGPYSLANCRWATTTEQARNRSNNHPVTHSGITLTLTEWAERSGVTRSALTQRLAAGWSMEEALSTEVRKFENRVLSYRGETLTIAAWAARLDIGDTTLRERLKAGWSVEDTLSRPARPKRPNGS